MIQYLQKMHDSFNDIDLSEYEEIKIDNNEVENIKNRNYNKLNKRKLEPIVVIISGLLLINAPKINKHIIYTATDEIILNFNE